MNLLQLIIPELILLAAAAVLFLMGGSNAPATRKLAPVVALAALVAAFFASLKSGSNLAVQLDPTGSIAVTSFSIYIQTIAIAVSTMFVLLAWPSSNDGAGNDSINFSTETSEYFALLLLSVTGICIVAASNSLAMLFLGAELSSIPTYIMVTMSRPQSQAQEAGVKYFFLGAATAALMLLGMSYLFGVTGEMQLTAIKSTLRAQMIAGTVTSPMLILAITLLVMGFLFKLAAAPLHFYAGDVYQGAATPVTAAISFIPKATGIAALIKVLDVAGAGTWNLDPKLIRMIWIIAVLTMSVGNVLALLQYNVKRVLAYSSVAHSGYLLAGLAVVVGHTTTPALRSDALAAVAFYLLAYGVMNAAAFGVLAMLPSKIKEPARTAETYDDLAGTGWKHPVLGACMAIGCFSLIGIPSTVGFLGKLYLLKPAILGSDLIHVADADHAKGDSLLMWLAIIVMVNAAISAGYYLKIVATMWSKSDQPEHEAPVLQPWPAKLATAMSVIATLAIGLAFPLAGYLFNVAKAAAATFSVAAH